MGPHVNGSMLTCASGNVCYCNTPDLLCERITSSDRWGTPFIQPPWPG